MSNVVGSTKELLQTMAGTDGKPIGLVKAAGLVGKGATLDFSFEYLGFLFAVKAIAVDERTQIRFHANLGHLPFTFENPVGRSNAIAIFNVAGSALGGKVHITNGQRVLLTDESWFDEPMTPILLVSRAARLLTRAKPYLELLSSSINKPAVQAS